MTIGPISELQADSGPRVARYGVLLSVGAGFVGVLSYVVTLLMANALSPADFSQFAAAQMMLGMVGIVTSALVPLPLSHAVTAHPQGSEQRREAMAFAVLVSVMVGTVAALVTGLITAGLGSASTAAVVALSAFVLFIGAAPSGWIQGELRFVRYTVKSVGEVLIRLIFSLLVVVFAWGAPGAVLGFAVGGLALLVTPRSFLHDLTWRPKVLRQKWRWAETSDIALTLCVVSVLVGIDVVLVAFLDGGSTAAAGFQALASIAKAPVYVAAGTVIVVFPLLRRPGVIIPDVLNDALHSFARLSLAACAVIATTPHTLVALVLPEKYLPSVVLLPWLALSGLGYATLTVLATVLLALRAYRRCQIGLVTAAALVPSGLFLGWEIGGVTGIAICGAVGALAAAAVLAVIAFPLLPRETGFMAARAFAGWTALAAIMTHAIQYPIVWLVIVFVAGLFACGMLNTGNASKLLARARVTRRREATRRVDRLPRHTHTKTNDAENSGTGNLKKRARSSQNFEGARVSFVVCVALALGVRALATSRTRAKAMTGRTRRMTLRRGALKRYLALKTHIARSLRR